MSSEPIEPIEPTPPSLPPLTKTVMGWVVAWLDDSNQVRTSGIVDTVMSGLIVDNMTSRQRLSACAIPIHYELDMLEVVTSIQEIIAEKLKNVTQNETH